MGIAQQNQLSSRPSAIRRQRCARRSSTCRWSRLHYFVGTAFLLGLLISLSGRTNSPSSSRGGILLVEASKSTITKSKPNPSPSPAPSSSSSSKPNGAPLLLSEISDMRPKEIKRQLSRKYGYSPETLAQMINKKDLIETLAYEQHKDDEIKSKQKKSENIRQTIIVTLAVIVLFTFWPLIQKVIEILHINFVVYTDKRKYEVTRCLELKSVSAAFGVMCMAIIDGLSTWLSISVGLSWFMTRNKYFFPIPNIPVRPAALLATASGGAAGGGPMSHYGLNVGPMVITWIMRFALGQIEKFTGRRLSAAKLHREKMAKQERKEARRQAKEMMSDEDKEARKAAKRKTKEEEKEERRKEAAEAAPVEESKDQGPTEGDSYEYDQQGDSSTTNPVRSQEEMRQAAATAAEERGGVVSDNIDMNDLD